MTTPTTVMDRTQEKFLAFHNTNPHIYRALVKYAKELVKAGHKKSSIWLLANRVRWDFAVSTNISDQFKISNDYFSRYSRLIMQQEKSLAGFFTIKQLKAERA